MRSAGLAVVLLVACGGGSLERRRRAATQGSPARRARQGDEGGRDAPAAAAGDCARSIAWRAGASLGTGRRWHATVVLSDGRVLAAGGWPDGASSALYDPVRDEWRATGPLLEPRSEHTLTLLDDGRVLAAGGETSADPLDEGAARTSELFDPGSATWTPTASAPAVPRLGHTATRLRDGRVLVVGGHGSEIFDPETGAWHPAPSLRRARQLHSATLLPDGRVIVIGGQLWESDRNDAVREVEVLDAAQARWSLVTPIPEPRSGHTATPLLDGRLLVAGGWNHDHGRTLLVDLYDATLDRWAEAGELAVGRDDHSATLLADGHVVVVGGESNGSLARGLRGAVAEVYDPTTNRWIRPEIQPPPRMEHSAVLLRDGRLLVFGGVDSDYDPPLARVDVGRCP